MSGAIEPLFAGIVWGARAWLAPALVLLAIALAVLAWSYSSARGSKSLRWSCAGLKALGIALLAAMLLDPLWSAARARPGENVVLVVVDSSASMQAADRQGKPVAADTVRRAVGDERAPWLARLKQDFDVRRYAFAERLEPRPHFETLEFTGSASSLYSSLRSLGKRFAGRPVAGIVLFSDGTATDAAEAESLGTLSPVYPVLPPEMQPAADAAVAHVAATQSAFEDAPVTIVAKATAQGFGDRPLTARVVDEGGKIVASQDQLPAGSDGAASFRFQFRPEREGVSFYRVEVAPQARADAKPQATANAAGSASSSGKEKEATAENNVRWIAVDRGRGPYRVLYVGGAPNPEHKFLGRALADDPQVELVSLMRIARREPKFDFRTRAGETTNPLFRGFDKTNDETERYDQPVFVRLGIKDESELRDGFPKTAEQLFGYHAIVLDDVEADLFTTDQMTLLSRFVSERGGGLLMLGGTDSFAKGRFARTPVADALPVYVEQTGAPKPPPATGYRWQLTRDGRLEPWMRLRASEADEEARLATMPPFRTLNRTAGIKPGATVLAVAVESSGTEHPALVAHNYGRGRAVALLVGDLWRWRLQVDPENQDLEKMWRQLIHRLTTDVPGRLAASYEVAADDATPTVRIGVRVREPNFEPLDNAQVAVRVTSPDGKVLLLDAEPSRREAGLYEANFVPHGSGAFRATAKVVDGAGTDLGEVETGWTANPAADEFRRLTPDRDALKQLAMKTGGETVELSELDSFAAGLAARPAPETVQTLFPLWHTPAIFALAIACLAGEWGLRRWKGLP
jgi:hypothetical protein